MKHVFLLFLIVGVAGVVVDAQAESCCKSDPNRDAALEETASVSEELNQLLDRIEKRGRELKTFQARMLFKQKQPLIDALTIRNGRLSYQTDSKAIRFRIHFADFLQKYLEEDDESQPVIFDEDFVFDGRWLTRRNNRAKSIQKWEISKTPHNREIFRLGKGPFPLPFALVKSDIVREFSVKLLDLETKASEKTHHMELVPRQDSSFAETYVRWELWISKTSFLPEQFRYETNSNEITTITWSEIKIDRPIKSAEFNLKPAGNDWTVEVTPLEEPAPPQEQQEIISQEAP